MFKMELEYIANITNKTLKKSVKIQVVFFFAAEYYTASWWIYII